MRYFDTSFLVPLILPEATSDKISHFVEAIPATDLSVSHWTRTEFASMLARKVRMGELDPLAARAVDSQFETLVTESFAVLLPNLQDFNRAKEMLSHFETGLRAADALHLAIAGNRGSQAIYSLDTGMIAAGRKLGLPMSSGELLADSM